ARLGFCTSLAAARSCGPAGLLLVRVINRDRLGDLLAVGHLRRADVGIDFVAALQDVDFYVEMEFPHTFENGLPRFLVSGHAERRVLRYQLGESNAEFFLI